MNCLIGEPDGGSNDQHERVAVADLFLAPSFTLDARSPCSSGTDAGNDCAFMLSS